MMRQDNTARIRCWVGYQAAVLATQLFLSLDNEANALASLKACNYRGSML